MTSIATAAVEADLNYLLYTGQRPVGYAYPAPPGVPQQSGQPLPTRVRIENARALPEPPALDRQGFELRRAPTELRDFSDEAAILARIDRISPPGGVIVPFYQAAFGPGVHRW